MSYRLRDSATELPQPSKCSVLILWFSLIEIHLIHEETKQVGLYSRDAWIRVWRILPSVLSEG